MGGILGALVAVNTVLNTFPIQNNTSPTSKLCALIDNKALIHRIQKWSRPSISEVLAPEYLLAPSRTIAKTNNLVINQHHIKSHQDTDQEYELLPR
jgi:hypothetical protein